MILVWYILAFLLSLFITGLLCKHAPGIIRPDIPNERSSHTRPTPRGGGLALILSFYLAGFCMAMSGAMPYSLYFTVCVPGALVAIIGFADDVWKVSPLLRLLIHTLAATLFIVLAGNNTLEFSWFRESGIAAPMGFLLGVLGLVWCINLNNFMDGIDGIASVETISVMGGAALILWLGGGDSSVVIMLLLIATAVAGFLKWNWPPARIFMGDGGSGFLGFLTGALAFLSSTTGGIDVWSWLILYGVFFVDATYTLVRRIAGGEKFYQAHRSHTYQIMSRRLGSHKQVTLGVLVINIIWLFPLALASVKYSNLSVYFLAGAYLPLLVLALAAGAGTTSE